MKKWLFLVAISVSLFASDLVELGKEAYIYGYPAVLVETTKKSFLDHKHMTTNAFYHVRKFPSPDFKEIVSPNVDTLYSIAWLDLSEDPVFLEVPAMKRYYLLEVMDGWTNVFASIGSRTTGTDKGLFAFVGPEWKGTLPEGVHVYHSPTHLAWIIGRTETRGVSDYDAVHAIQDSYKLKAKKHERGEYTFAKPPVEIVSALNASSFFTQLATLLKHDIQPLPADTEQLKKLAGVGIVPGQSFEKEQLPPDGLKQLDESVLQAKKVIERNWKDNTLATVENGWRVLKKGIGEYGTNYLARATVAYGGLGANLPQDALYPMARVDSEGSPLTGTNNYKIHFFKDSLPPVNGFWSVTLYNEEQFFYPNKLSRQALGDRDDLQYNEDGSLTLYIQHAPPVQESNWLPAPAGPFNLIMRLYWPDEEILSGKWLPPPVLKANLK